jgi:ABC-type amino acid transport substrate-binding protein
VWFFERGNPDFNDNFGPGFPDARFFVHVVISSTGFGNQIPKSKWGRRITVILMYSGIGFMFPMITGRISSEMTTYQLNSSIKTKEDLSGKKVAVKRGTTSVEATEKLGAKIYAVRDMDSALVLLKNGTVDAIVHDIPALKCMKKNTPDITVLDILFEEQDYGIILPQGSPMKESINRSILKFHESGLLEQLKEKWLNG